MRGRHRGLLGKVFVAARRRSAVAGLAVWFPLLAFVASFQVSTVGHFVSDLVQVLAVGQPHHEAQDQDEDDPNHECPPGCPNCHHTHLSGASVPMASATTLVAAPAAAALAQPRSSADRAPSGPELPSVYRPPRV